MVQASVTDRPPVLRHRNSSRNIATLVMLLFLVYFFLPLFWLVVSSTKTNSQLFSSFGLWVASTINIVENVRDVFAYDDGVYLTWLLNTAQYAVISAVGAAFLATLSGYAFAKFRFRGRNTAFAAILGSIMVPQTALVIPTYLLLSKIGLINTPLAVILPSLVNPLGVYLMRVYSEQSVPDELIDAARVDGAGELRIFWSVAFRILTPGFVTVLLLSFVATWNNYFLPLTVLSEPTLYPVTVGLAAWNDLASASGAAQALYTLVITGALIAILPLIAAFLFLQRYWQGGLTFGSVK
ncbi:MAG: carbohydrate ABC transporter permease [Actinobacteria bacterium]|nr:carbohydrate ABC transporter permease [Actinomycetota bacterium]